MNTDGMVHEALQQQLRDAMTLESLRVQAANDWDRQQALNDELMSAYQRVLTEQRETDAAELAATRKRVVIELLGLALVAFGTALPDLTRAIW